jgi:hypothetical protein
MSPSFAMSSINSSIAMLGLAKQGLGICAHYPREECVVGPQHAKYCQCDPKDDNNHARNAAHGFAVCNGFLGSRSAFIQYGRRNHLDGQGDAHRNQDKVVEIAQYRNEVGDQIDWAEGISHDAGDEELRIPRCLRMARSKIECKGLRLETTRALFKFAKYLHLLASSRRPSSSTAPIPAWRLRRSLRVLSYHPGGTS